RRDAHRPVLRRRLTSRAAPTCDPNSACCQLLPNCPRLRAWALFGRRPLQRVVSLVIPATKNLHTSGHPVYLTFCWSAPRRRDLTARMCSVLNFSTPLLCFTSGAPTYMVIYTVCLRAAHKSETYRSLRSLKAAALVPSAGTSKIPTGMVMLRVLSRTFRRRKPQPSPPTPAGASFRPPQLAELEETL